MKWTSSLKCDVSYQEYIRKVLYPRPPKGGGLLQPPCDFSQTFLGNQPKVTKRLYVIYTNTNASFHKKESEFGGLVWVGGVVKVFGSGWGV